MCPIPRWICLTGMRDSSSRYTVAGPSLSQNKRSTFRSSNKILSHPENRILSSSKGKWNFTDLSTYFASLVKLVSFHVLAVSRVQRESRRCVYPVIISRKGSSSVGQMSLVVSSLCVYRIYPERILFKWHIYSNLKGLCWLLKIMKSISNIPIIIIIYQSSATDPPLPSFSVLRRS